MATILNLTPHAVTVLRAPAESSTGSWILTEMPCMGGAPNEHRVYPPSGVVARVDMVTTDADPAPDGAPCVHVAYGRADLPVDADADAFIVSTMFADAYRRQHGDNGVVLLVPDSGPSAVREGGQVVAVRQFIRR